MATGYRLLQQCDGRDGCGHHDAGKVAVAVSGIIGVAAGEAVISESSLKVRNHSDLYQKCIIFLTRIPKCRH